MNIEQIEYKIKELQEELEKLKKKENKRWRAETRGEYFYITPELEVDDAYENDLDTDDDCYKYHNYFKTEEEAQEVADNIKTHIELMELAEELNTAPVDWEDDMQPKYYLFYMNLDKKIDTNNTYTWEHAGDVYCTNSKFASEAIKRIGEERLIRYLKGE